MFWKGFEILLRSLHVEICSVTEFAMNFETKIYSQNCLRLKYVSKRSVKNMRVPIFVFVGQILCNFYSFAMSKGLLNKELHDFLWFFCFHKHRIIIIIHDKWL